jgi:hypothetical protein
MKREAFEIVMRGLVPRIHVFLIASRPSSGKLPRARDIWHNSKRRSALSDERSEPVVDLAYIGRALQRLTAEVASLRDDMHVLTAIVQRLDNSQGRMLEELRAMHRQQSRFGERLRQPEEQHSP